MPFFPVLHKGTFLFQELPQTVSKGRTHPQFDCGSNPHHVSISSLQNNSFNADIIFNVTFFLSSALLFRNVSFHRPWEVSQLVTQHFTRWFLVCFYPVFENVTLCQTVNAGVSCGGSLMEARAVRCAACPRGTQMWLFVVCRAPCNDGMQRN